MSTRTASDGDEPLIERREQLVAPMQAGEKPRERWRIGTEHEKFVYQAARPSRARPTTSPAASATC